jgi:pyruvate-formate lyase-activating enzyme
MNSGINIIVDRLDLLRKLLQERSDHRETFLTAQVVYRQRVIEELDRRLADIRAGKKIDVHIRLPVPEDYTEDYDTIIAMLEWHKEPQIEMTPYDFSRYVEGKWDWRESFTRNTTAYTAGADPA